MTGTKAKSGTDNTQLAFFELEQRIGHRFGSSDHLADALTHASARPLGIAGSHYERLEFLGDRVLGLAIAQLLFQRFPEASEGELSLRFNALVKGETLAEISDELGLHEFIRTGGDMKELTGKRMTSVRADVLEALIAAIYFDGGIEAVSAFIERFWKTRLSSVVATRRDAKTQLQEWAHSNRLPIPKYIETERTGPDHEPSFTVEVRVGEIASCAGTGGSKRLAERDAAQRFLLREELIVDDDCNG